MRVEEPLRAREKGAVSFSCSVFIVLGAGASWMNHIQICPYYSPAVISEISECWWAVYRHPGRKRVKTGQDENVGEWKLKGSDARAQAGGPSDRLAAGVMGAQWMERSWFAPVEVPSP